MSHPYDQHTHQADFASMDEHGDPHPAPTENPEDRAPEQTTSSDLETGMLGMVEQVGQQLQRLREAQRVQDEELARLNERFSRLEEAESELKELRSAIDQQRQSSHAERHDLDEQRQALIAEREQWNKSINGREADLSRHWVKLTARENALAERTVRDEGDEVSRAEREQWEKSFSGREADLARHQEKLASREAALAERASQVERQCAQLNERDSHLHSEREKLLQRVDQAERNVGELVEQLETLQRTLEERDALLESHVSQRTALEAQLDEARQAAEPLQQQLADRDERLAELEAQLEHVQSSHASSSTADQAVLQSLRDRIEELEQQLQQAHSAATSAESTQQQLQEKAKHIDAVAGHVRRRQARLKKMRLLLRERRESKQAKADQHEVHAEELRAIEKQMQRLNEAKDALTASEHKMVRRWARPRAVITVGWIVLLIAANIAVSWLLASQFFPPERTAWVTLAPETRSGDPLSSERIESWQQWHVATLNDDGFHRTLARRFEARGMAEVESESAVRDLITEHLGVDVNRNGSLTLTLAGHDRHTLPQMLDVLAMTLAAESHRRAGTRGDGARAVVRGERHVGDQLRYATLNPWTNNDRRIFWIGPLLLLTLGASCALILLVYRRLIQAKRVFDEHGAV